MSNEKWARSASPRRRVLFALLAAALGMLVAALAVEASAQVYITSHRAYRNACLEPDAALGWKLVPKLEWTNTGWRDDGYAREFSVRVTSNERGFRDAERREEKPPGVVRVALLGDSLVEAAQVPFEKTAGQRLEARLSAARGSPHEVLNFGISGFGLGQFLLAYEHHARRFRPDHVAVLVAVFHFTRTFDPYAFTAFPAARDRRLFIRPSFGLRDGRLFCVPPRDTEECRRVQAAVLESQGGGRSRVVPRRLFLGELLGGLLPAPAAAAAAPPVPDEVWGEVDRVNLAILSELHRQVAASGARLTILDGCKHFSRGDRSAEHAALLERHARAIGAGYVDLSAVLDDANARGRKTEWPHDGHLNEAGNELVAEALLRALP